MLGIGPDPLSGEFLRENCAVRGLDYLQLRREVFTAGKAVLIKQILCSPFKGLKAGLTLQLPNPTGDFFPIGGCNCPN